MRSGPPQSLLAVRDLQAGYGKKQVLHSISLSAKSGEIIAVLGPNGSGKSTLLKAVFGLIKTTSGSVEFRNKQIQNRSPLDNVREGISFGLQGSRVFSELSVVENLEMGGYTLTAQDLKRRIEDILSLFPTLRDMRARNAITLSTGEKQMLAMARALMLEPILLLLDEPSLGLAPRTVHDMLQHLHMLNQQLKTTIVLVEQNVHEALSIANKVYVLRLGRIALEGTPDRLTMEDLRTAFLG